MAEPDYFTLARSYLGTEEIPGSEHNQIILDWFEASGHGWIKDDETAWCMAFVNGVLVETGYKGTGSVAARSALDWGVKVTAPKPGDIAVFWRVNRNGWQGHVGFYVGTTNDGSIRVLGGNQKNGVNIDTMPAHRLLGYRRPATMRNSNAVKGIVPTLGGGAVVLTPAVQDTVAVVQGQQEALTSGNIVALAVGAVIVIGALVALYAKWQDAGSPTPWKKRRGGTETPVHRVVAEAYNDPLFDEREP